MEEVTLKTEGVGPTAPESPIDYERAYKVLCAALGREFVSSSVLYFSVLAVRDAVGVEAARVAADHMGLNRSKETHSFMG